MTPEDAKQIVQGTADRSTTFLGSRTSRMGREKKIGVRDESRFLHVLNTGPTGSGKTALLVHAALESIYKDYGVCVVVPAGNAVDQILAKMPEDRLDDVVYINPVNPYTEGAPALNVLEPYITERNGEKQKEIITNDVISLFKSRSENWGDRFGRFLDHLLRAHIQLNIDNGESNNLFDVYECIQDKEKLESLIQRTRDDIRRKQLRRIKNEYSGKELNPVEYRLEDFTGNELLRDVISAGTSGIDFRDAVNSQKIILVELQKGGIGEETSQVIGTLILTKIWSAIQSRVALPIEKRAPFHLYIDEMQNYANADGSSLATMAAEGRKYRLGLWLTTQYLSRLNKQVRNAVEVNCRTKIVFQPSDGDTRSLAQLLEVKKDVLRHLDEYRAVVQRSGNGQGRKVTVVDTLPPFAGDRSADEVDEVKEVAALNGSPCESRIEQSPGSGGSAGGEIHGQLLKEAKRYLEFEEGVDVDILKQDGSDKPDAHIIGDDYVAHLEAEHSTLGKPEKVMKNLDRATEQIRKCVFIVAEPDVHRLENILEEVDDHRYRILAATDLGVLEP